MVPTFRKTARLLPYNIWLQLPNGILRGLVEVFLAIALIRFFAYAGWVSQAENTSALDSFLPSGNPLVIFVGLGAARIFLTWTGSFLASVGFESFLRKIREHSINNLCISEFGPSSRGLSHLANIQTNLAGAASIFLTSFSQLLGGILAVTATTVALFRLSPAWALLTITFFILSTLPIIVFRRAVRTAARHMHHFTAEYARRSTQAFQNLEFLHLSGQAEVVASDLHEVNRNIFHFALHQNLWVTLSQQIPVIAGFGLISLLVGRLVNPAKWGGQFLYLVFQSASLSGILIARFVSCWLHYPRFKELSSIINEGHSKPPAYSDVTIPTPALSTLELRNLRVGRNEPLTPSLSLTLQAGQMLCLFGASGSGKTTCLLTILGAMPALEGKVLWDSQDVSEIASPAFRSAIAFVSSDPFLLDLTVRENLLYGKQKTNGKWLSDSLLWESLEIACAAEFVSGLPKTLNTELGEGGAGLSSGQKQRLAIARALASHPRVLVLDEATSNLDEDLERRILKQIRHRWPELMIIASSHRTSFRSLPDVNHLVELNFPLPAELRVVSPTNCRSPLPLVSESRSLSHSPRLSV